jgi:hypothetical protein
MPEELKSSFQSYLLDNITEAVDRLREAGHEDSQERTDNIRAIRTSLELLEEM